jgi:hypothetical protein
MEMINLGVCTACDIHHFRSLIVDHYKLQTLLNELTKENEELKEELQNNSYREFVSNRLKEE